MSKYHKGAKFNRLTLMEKVDKGKWLCKCDCGNEKVIAENHIGNNHTKSCGCLNREIITKHGQSRSRIYKTYNAMKDRCTNPNSQFYKDYGARGIRICDEWLGDDGFKNFYDWAMTNGYTDDLTIDRVDVNGNYEPNNCRWTDMKTQNNNLRTNRKITIDGITHTVSEWSEIVGIKRETIFSRLRSGMDEKDAIMTPLLRKRGN